MPALVTVADASGARGILHRETLTATNDSIAIPSGAIGKWLHAFSSTSSAQYGISTTGAPRTLIYDQDVAAGTGHPAAGATIPAGLVSALGVIPKDATHLSWIGPAGAAGKIEFYVSEAPLV